MYKTQQIFLHWWWIQMYTIASVERNGCDPSCIYNAYWTPNTSTCVSRSTFSVKMWTHCLSVLDLKRMHVSQSFSSAKGAAGAEKKMEQVVSRTLHCVRTDRKVTFGKYQMSTLLTSSLYFFYTALNWITDMRIRLWQCWCRECRLCQSLGQKSCTICSHTRPPPSPRTCAWTWPRRSRDKATRWAPAWWARSRRARPSQGSGCSAVTARWHAW